MCRKEVCEREVGERAVCVCAEGWAVCVCTILGGVCVCAGLCEGEGVCAHELCLGRRGGVMMWCVCAEGEVVCVCTRFGGVCRKGVCVLEGVWCVCWCQSSLRCVSGKEMRSYVASSQN